MLGLLVSTVLPKDFISVTYKSGAKLSVDFDSFAKKSVFGLTTDDIEKMFNEKDGGNVSLNDKIYAVEELDVDGHKLIMDAQTADRRTFNLNNLALICGSVAFYLACLFVTVTFISKLCKSFEKCANPFEEIVIKRITYVTFAVIPYVVINPLLMAVIDFASGKSDKVNFFIDFGQLFIILVLIVLCGVFKYGAALQKESDETL